MRRDASRERSASSSGQYVAKRMDPSSMFALLLISTVNRKLPSPTLCAGEISKAARARPAPPRTIDSAIAGVLVQRELESRGQGVREHRAAPYRLSRGLLPRRFIASAPIPKGRSGGAVEGNRPPFGLGPWIGARVGPHRSPILRPGQVTLYRACQRHMSTVCVIACSAARDFAPSRFARAASSLLSRLVKIASSRPASLSCGVT